MKELTAGKDKQPFLEDESRYSGSADIIYFPENTTELVEVLRKNKHQQLTMQGARTGVTAGAVPEGGAVINLSHMNKILDIRELSCNQADSSAGDFCTGGIAFVEPGLLLCHLRDRLKTTGLRFAPDPTETTASLGGMVNCNSSGARSYRYGSTRDHILGLQIVLADGDIINIRRGQYLASGLDFSICTESGRLIKGRLPDINMPSVAKNTAGYYIRPDMDLLDLFIGSEGTLGIITRIELRLLPEQKHLWGALLFFEREKDALTFVEQLRTVKLPLDPEAIEFFGADTLDMLSQAQATGRQLTDSPTLPESGCGVYTEFLTDDRALLEPLFKKLTNLISSCGGDPDDSWVAITSHGIKRLKDFRHAAPVCVNEKISLIRRQYPEITKLGTDMSVPDERLRDVFSLYRRDLAHEGFLSSTFGHIGNNHLHVNIVPRDPDEYAHGKQLYTRWADQIVRMGGSVSSEHGIGKMKTWLLQRQYNAKELQSMLELKLLFDPNGQLNQGNIFG